jgi:hypothetical protein
MSPNLGLTVLYLYLQVNVLPLRGKTFTCKGLKTLGERIASMALLVKGRQLAILWRIDIDMVRLCSYVAASAAGEFYTL